MERLSMTGFGKGDASNDHYNITVEIKSVNNRYKDFRFRIPSMFSHIELELRKKLESKFKRGSFDISTNYKIIDNKNEFSELDETKISSFLNKMKLISKANDVELSIRPTDFLRREFYADDEENKSQELVPLLKKAFDFAIDELTKSRQDEGDKLVNIIKKHKQDYIKELDVVKANTSSYETTMRERILKKFEEYKEIAQIEEQRFLQEVVYYLEKLDIHEELNRINTHLQKLDKILSEKGEVGRQLDFILQELNRETNTIGSKSGNTVISNAVVQMKVHLEKIREQALNME